MKKVLSLFLVAIMMISLLSVFGCDNGEGTVTTKAGATEASMPYEDGSASEEITEPAPVIVRSVTVDNMSEWVKFNGRVYTDTSEKTVHFDWSLSGFEINFYGTGVKAEIVSSLGASPEKNTMIYAFVDGNENTDNPIWLNRKAEVITLAENLPEGRHTLKVVKRNCVSKASAGVRSIEILGSEAATFTEKPAKKDILIEFIGDSITSGDGVLTPGGQSGWISVCQDATCSYANHIAKKFNADVNLVSRCGGGLIWNSSGLDASSGGIPMPSVYDYACKYNSAEKWDFAGNQPDLIIINLGTNDRKQIIPSEGTVNAANRKRWMNEYETFLKHVREVNPGVPIICTYGAMLNSTYDLGLEEVVKKVTADGMEDVYYMREPKTSLTGVGGHPAARSHQAIATSKYVPFISGIFPDWKKY